MSQQSKKTLEKLRAEVEAARGIGNVATFSGVGVIPLIFVGIFTGNQALSAASLCWLISHFIGYTARIAQEQQKQALLRLNLAEATFSAKQSIEEAFPTNHVSLN